MLHLSLTQRATHRNAALRVAPPGLTVAGGGVHRRRDVTARGRRSVGGGVVLQPHWRRGGVAVMCKNDSGVKAATSTHTHARIHISATVLTMDVSCFLSAADCRLSLGCSTHSLSHTHTRGQLFTLRMVHKTAGGWIPFLRDQVFIKQ